MATFGLNPIGLTLPGELPIDDLGKRDGVGHASFSDLNDLARNYLASRIIAVHQIELP